nr:TRAP transporter small permease [Sulfitobacter aestuariivivens]
MITCDVIGRNLFATPVAGVPEMVSLSIVAIVFLQAPQALSAGRMTRSDGVIDILHARRPRIAAALETLFDGVGILVLGAILFAHWPIMTRSWERGDFIGAVGNFTAPTWPVKVMLAIGATLLALQFAARILRRFSR